MEIKHKACSAARSYTQNQLEAEILTALLSGDADATHLAARLEVPDIVVIDRLKKLEERGAVHLLDQKWGIR